MLIDWLTGQYYIREVYCLPIQDQEKLREQRFNRGLVADN